MIRIAFKCRTNLNICMINTAKFILPNGTVLTVDRTDTEYTAENGLLNMTWKNCYLWAINDCCIFGDYLAYLDMPRDMNDLLKGTKVEFEIEDDAPLNYKVDCIWYCIT